MASNEGHYLMFKPKWIPVWVALIAAVGQIASAAIEKL